MIIKVISLWQPWASLMAWLFKEYETRSWTTSYRGWMAIHAAKYRGDEFQIACRDPEFQAYFRQIGIHNTNEFPFGCILSVGWLESCQPTGNVVQEISGQERLFGNYQPGRWAWRFTDMRRLPEPIAFRGTQGIFNWEVPSDLVARLKLNAQRTAYPVQTRLKGVL